MVRNEQIPWWRISLCFTFKSGRLARPDDIKHKNYHSSVMPSTSLSSLTWPYGQFHPTWQRQAEVEKLWLVRASHSTPDFPSFYPLCWSPAHVGYHLGCVNVRVFKSVVILSGAGSFGVCDSDTWQVTIEPSASRFRCSSFRLLPSSSSTFLPSIVHT